MKNRIKKRNTTTIIHRRKKTEFSYAENKTIKVKHGALLLQCSVAM